MSYSLSETERAILRMVQGNIPDSMTPYADIANSIGIEENVVLELLQFMKDDGIIRRFGASIKHQQTGWNYNAMVAWEIDDKLIDEVGEQAAQHPSISHCYHRPSTAEDWPYTLYTMIHGRNKGDCEKVIKQLKSKTVLKEYAILESIKELKKTSMKYFQSVNERNA